MSGLKRLGKLSLATSAAMATLTMFAPGALAQARAQEASANAISVDSQDLGSALRALARQTGMQIVFEPGAVSGRLAPEVRNAGSPEQALQRMLADSGLTYRSTGRGTYTILAQATQAPPTQLDGAEQAASSEEEIVVTARKREESLIDVPAAITAFTDAAITDTGAREISDFIEASPGVSMVADGAFQQLAVRGVATSLGGNANGYYLDDVPFTGVSVPWNPNVQPFDLERVEVLRGPQGTLFGEGSMGGTIRILTHAPELGEFVGRVEGSTSSTNDGDSSNGVRAMLNLPLFGDRVALRVVGLHEERGGWLEGPLGEQDYNSEEVTTYRARLRVAPTSRLTIDLGVWDNDQTIEGRSNALDSGIGPGPQPVAQGYRQYSASAAYDADWVQLRYAFGQTNLTNTLSSEIPGFGTLSGDIDILVTTHELIGSGEIGNLNWTLGYYQRTADRNDGLVLGPFDTDTNYYSEARAIFAEGEYRLSDRWRIALGVRAFDEELNATEVGNGFFGPIDSELGGSFDSVNPRLVLTYEASDDHLFYLSAAKGFRGGQVQPAVSAQIAGLFGIPLPPTLPPDSIWTYELGSKLRFMEGRFFVEGALYYSEWSDVPVRFELIPGAINGLATAPGTETIGLELSATFRLTDALTLNGGASLVGAEFIAGVPGSPIQAGDTPENVSDVTWNAALAYRAPAFAGFDLFGRVGAQFVSARENTSSAGNTPGDDVTLVDARFGLENDRFGAYLFIDNLTDEDGALSARNVQGATRPRPLTIGVDLSARF
jgi:outer membrane receptor protein involved in Fe transport